MRKVSKEEEERVREVSIKLAALLKDYFRDNFLSLANFGSVARGEIREGSDIDFLIVLKEAAKSYGKRLKMLFPVLKDLEKRIEYKELEKMDIYLEPSFIIFSKKEIENHPPLLLDMIEESVILYDKRNFLKRELEKMRMRMKRLGSFKNRLPDGSWYWVLKPGLKVGEVFEI